MADQFSADIIYEILSRLPIKSLALFRCVCKSWLKYINHPYLQTIHRVQEEPTPIMFKKSHYYELMNQCEISFLRVIQGTTTVRKEPVLDFCFTGSCCRTLVLGSCNGLILVCYRFPLYDGRFFLALINPLTKQCYNLPPIKIIMTNFYLDRVYEAAGIGFDDFTNTLKTVYVILKTPVRPQENNNPQLRAMVHYSGLSSWREIAQIPACPIRGEGVFANGRLHWLGDERKIVWFDVKMEEFGVTDAPKPKLGSWGTDYDRVRLVDLNGEVGIAYSKHFGIRIELWMLKGEEWVSYCRFDLNTRSCEAVVLGCWNKDGDILLTSNSGEELFVYTLKTGDLREADWGDPCEAEIRMYRSSLFTIRGINTSDNYSIKTDDKNV